MTTEFGLSSSPLLPCERYACYRRAPVKKKNKKPTFLKFVIRRFRMVKELLQKVIELDPESQKAEFARRRIEELDMQEKKE